MLLRKQMPVALSVAGSDSGGGAGIQADLKTFAALGVHGTSAITCLTAQNPKGVRGIQAARPEIVRRQIEAVFAELPPKAVKTGILLTAGIVREVANFFRRPNRPPLIVDPVLMATTGRRLLEPSAEKFLREKLLPVATLVTPNLREAAVLSGREVNTVEAMRAAAREIRSRYGCAALVKGGHLRGVNEAVDIFFDGRTELLLTVPFIKGVRTHGTGCTYSAAIAGYLALGHSLPRAVELAKEFITQAIAHSARAGRHTVLNYFLPAA